MTEKLMTSSERESLRKRARSEEPSEITRERNAEHRFLLQITCEGEDAACYSAPLDSETVRKVKAAIVQAAKIEKEFQYPEVTTQLATCLVNRIVSDCMDEEETIINRQTIRNSMSGERLLNIPKFSIDTRNLITAEDRSLWITDNRCHKSSLLDEEPKVLYQVHVMQGWC
jgi:hypothetical protein